jgi:hypothetical protein
MSLDRHDDLLMRVRRSDPAADARRRDATDSAAARHPDDDAVRAAVTAARARRDARGRLGVGAGLGGLAALATAAVVALGATTAGPVAAKPRVRQIVARAAQATDPTPNTIVMVDSVRVVRWTGGGDDDGIRQRTTAFVLFGRDGSVVANRSRRTEGDSAVGLDEVSYQQNGIPVEERYDPVGRTTTRTERAWTVPSPVFSAHKLFVQAQRGEKRMRLLGQTTVGERRAWRLLVTGADEEPLDGDRDELLVDAASYEPLELRRHSEQVRDGERYTHDSSERVLDYRVLPDTAANRELLRVQGPLRPAR